MNKKKSVLLEISRKVLPKKLYAKLKSIDDHEEFKEASKYSLLCHFEKKGDLINSEIKILEDRGKDTFFVRNLFLMLPYKIKNFEAYLDKEAFYKLDSLIKKIEKEMKNVKVV